MKKRQAKHKIVDVIFNDLPPSKYDYKYFTIVYESGCKRKFHHHKNNPIPNKEQIIGLDLSGLRELVAFMFYEAVTK